MKANKKVIKFRTKIKIPFEVTVKGISMTPFLHEGDIVKIKQIETYDVGDIVLFSYNNEGLILHRVIDFDETIFYCRGDNAIRVEKIKKGDILGKVIDI